MSTTTPLISRLRIPIIATVILLLPLAALWSTYLQLARNRLSIIPSDAANIHTGSGNTGEAELQVPTLTASQRPLILYAYFETDLARTNLNFFLAHGLHGAADFIFILNGETTVEDLIPKEQNIRILSRPNTCYDLGAFAEVLGKDDMYKGYQRFIFMNASVRGPFIPVWSNGCWSDMYLNKLSDTVKLVGLTVNCEIFVHVQSMLWATDIIGLETLLYPSPETVTKFESLTANRGFDQSGQVPEPAVPGINWCPLTFWEAVSVEVYSTSLILAAGYKFEVMETAFYGDPEFEKNCWTTGNVLYNTNYFGIDLSPYEMVFMKANRNIAPAVLARYTEWVDGRNYSSYDYCAEPGLQRVEGDE